MNRDAVVYSVARTIRPLREVVRLMSTTHTTPPSTPRSGLLRRAAHVFAVDVRSLAIFRIGLAIVLLYDVVDRLTNLTAFHSDLGVLPRALLAPFYGWKPSLYLLSGRPLVQGLLLGVAGMLALLLLIGARTRLATIGSFIFVLSVQNRNPMVIDGRDTLMHLLLLWSCFLPLGAQLSFDAVRAEPRRVTDTQVVSIPAAVLLVQMCLLYWASGAYKALSPAWVDGSALSLIFGADQIARPLARTLHGHPDLLRFLTHATVYLEIGGPFLAFSPWRHGPLRTVAVVMFVGFHAVLGLTIYSLGLFPFVCGVGWLAFLPGWLWNRTSFFDALEARIHGWIARHVGGPRARPAAAPSRFLSPRNRKRLADAFSVGAFAIGLHSIVIVFSFFHPEIVPGLGRPPRSLRVASVTGLAQGWSLFAWPEGAVDTWLVVVGHRADGSEVDLRTGGPVRWDRPADLTVTFDSPLTGQGDRWTEYMTKLSDGDGPPGVMPAFAQYLCREWRRTRGETLEAVALHRLEEPGASSANATPVRTQVFHEACE